jgi:hypothetical protein
MPEKLRKPLPKTPEREGISRDRILHSFSDATELYPEKERKNLIKSVLISIIVVAIIAALYYYRIRLE